MIAFLGMRSNQSQIREQLAEHNSVLQRLSNQTMISGLDFTPFIYYPKQNIFYNYASDLQASAAIRDLADKTDQDRQLKPEQESLPGSWTRMTLNGREYIYILLYYQDYFIGAWRSFDDFYPGLSDTEDESYYYDHMRRNCFNNID